MGHLHFHIPRILNFYHDYVKDHDLLYFLKKTEDYYSPGTLARLTQHHSASVRRASVLALNTLGNYRQNAILAASLHDPDTLVSILAEAGIKMLWKKDGTAENQHILHEIIQSIHSEKLHQAISLATHQIQVIPTFAEMWHQRGNAWYQLNNYSQAVTDYSHVLKLNPYHFVAASQLGFTFLHLNKPKRARAAFRQALRINPSLKNVQIQLKLLKTR
ncbi:MAG: tetratricopeptide repeat protein [Planctomycetia bacterium]|nr:tetratricopeptide repeat protein [Planctomycetia bacterium]